MGWDASIRSLTHMYALDESDSGWFSAEDDMGVDFVQYKDGDPAELYFIGPNDLDRMKHMRNTLEKYRTLMKMITVHVNITAPLYWWNEFDNYKVGTVDNSCYTMYKIAAKNFTIDYFSYEHLMDGGNYILNCTIDMLNEYRTQYLKTKDKKYWWQIIQLLPSSYNQKRTVMMNYEVLTNFYKSRRNHKLDEWCEHKESTCSVKDDARDCKNPKEWLLCEDCSVEKSFCDWIKTLPYSELITLKEKEENNNG